jgi:hypothetical protein
MSDLYVVVQGSVKVSKPESKELAESQVKELNKQLLESKSDKPKYEVKQVLMG